MREKTVPHSKILRSSRVLAALSVNIGCLISFSASAHAAEGGGSHFLQGTKGDFAIAAVGPPGLYFRNDLSFQTGDIGAVSRGNFILSGLDQDVWVNNLKFTYLFDAEIFGAQPGINISIPYALEASVSGTAVAPSPLTSEGSRSGFADPSVTGMLGWKAGEASHFFAGLTAYSDFGSYSADRVINLGRNYWTFNPTAAYTWLDPRRGHEFSLLGGVMFNTENPATNYETGTEYHIGALLGQHFSKEFAIGLKAYHYGQMSDDKGALAGAIPVGDRGFRSSSTGAGLAVKWTPTIGDRDVTFIAKWLHDIEAKNRLESDLFMLSVAMKF